ncbi:MAG: Csu type fimbrial protein [Methylohalobius sp. ZOD2]|nr:spore coat protein U domain-containing protein [Methylothermaceae bacterium]
MQTQTIRRVATCATASLVVAYYAQIIHSATEKIPLNDGATVSTSCRIETSELRFNNDDPLDGTGSVAVTCAGGTSATIILGQGASADSGSTDDAPLRRMTDGTHYLSYNLYQNAARSTVWGNTAATGVSANCTGAADIHTIYGRIAGGQNISIDHHTDTVIATVTF